MNSEKLRELRTLRVMSMRELADIAEVSKNTVWNIENGTGKAHAQTIRKLAKALEVEPSVLIVH